MCIVEHKMSQSVRTWVHYKQYQVTSISFYSKTIKNKKNTGNNTTEKHIKKVYNNFK